jgi:hypothetical protein
LLSGRIANPANEALHISTVSVKAVVFSFIMPMFALKCGYPQGRQIVTETGGFGFVRAAGKGASLRVSRRRIAASKLA